MAGKDKYAQQMASLLGEPVEAACPISRPGGSAAQIGMASGGVIGAAIASKGGKDMGDVAIGQQAWLGLTSTYLALTKTSFMGKPTGEPLAKVAYADVTGVELTEGKITLRADLLVADGRHIAFEVKRLGNGKQSVEVLELLRSRCTT